MIRYILTRIYNQRRNNLWIFLELLVVVSILWVMFDSLLVDTYTYHQPMGVDINRVFHAHLKKDAQASDSIDCQQDARSLLQLRDWLRQNQEVESVSLSINAIPYAWGTNWQGLIAAEDTTTQHIYRQVFFVTNDYFKVLHIPSAYSHSLYDEVQKNPGHIVISKDFEEILFPNQSGVGRMVKYGNFPGEPIPPEQVSAVTAPRRSTDFERNEACYYYLFKTEQDLLSYGVQGQYFDCLIRMKKDLSIEEMENFLAKQGDRLSAGKLYISSVTPVKAYRDDRLKSRFDNQKRKTALIGFMMLNIFFGIVGTFWLRTQSRKAEIGLQAALGASKRQLQGQLYGEGLCLLALTLPVVLLFIGNMLLFDMPDTYRLPYTWWRFLATLVGSYLLMATMIYIGIRFPARKIARMNPADALHYE